MNAFKTKINVLNEISNDNKNHSVQSAVFVKKNIPTSNKNMIHNLRKFTLEIL